MTAGSLCELCPIENAAMEGRTVIQWNKDDLDELGILKVDVLALGMLSALHRCFRFSCQASPPQTWRLATVPQDDKATYDMICAADTIGVFQIESRAQMSMLPRLKPRCYYDLVVEVAIVRPGPIQGNMVHPYLQARENPDSVVYPNDAIRGVLEKTLGVPIFQEQAMRLAVVAAGFTPGEADQLRRAMAAWRRPGVIDQFRVKLLEGMKDERADRRLCRTCVQSNSWLRRIRFPRITRGQFCLAGVRLVLFEVPLPGCVLRGHFEQSADGFLCSGAVGCRCTQAWCPCAWRRRQSQRVGIDAGVRCESPATCDSTGTANDSGFVFAGSDVSGQRARRWRPLSKHA